MEMSQEIDKLMPAYVKMQGALSNAYKGKQGHGYSYADLHQCIQTAKPHLEENRLAVTQLLDQSEQGTSLVTMIMHESGQWMRSAFMLPEAVLQGAGARNPAQVMGSAITYARRYAYAAILGMAQTDDDAASLSESPTSQEAAHRTPPHRQQDKEPQWYNGFEQDRPAMLADVQAGKMPEQIIADLKGAGWAINKKTHQAILNLRQAGAAA